MHKSNMTTSLLKTLSFSALFSVLTAPYSLSMENGHNLKEAITSAAYLNGPMPKKKIPQLTHLIWNTQEPIYTIKRFYNKKYTIIKNRGFDAAFVASAVKNLTINLAATDFGTLAAEEIELFFKPFLDEEANTKTQIFFDRKEEFLLQLQQEQNLHRNNLEDLAFEYFFNIKANTKTPRTFLTIDLSDNALGSINITNRTLQTLWTELARIPNLHELNLSHNTLNKLPLARFKEMLKILFSSKSLKRLIILLNGLSRDKKQAIETFLSYEKNRYQQPEEMIEIITELPSSKHKRHNK